MNKLDAVFSIDSSSQFESAALETFRFQYRNNKVYRRFAELTGRTPEHVKKLTDIPFLPVEMFKYYEVVSAGPPYDAVFRSSGTTGMERSRHFVKNLPLYRRSFLAGFRYFYGDPKQYTFLALLPSYLERNDASLVYMTKGLMEASGRHGNGFYLDEYDRLIQLLQKTEAAGETVILIGVSFALLELARDFPFSLRHTIIMETGGMKGRGKELVREELHARLKESFGLAKIHSEYGMTELLSQAYSKGEGKFKTPPWMKIFIRDPEDPFAYLNQGKTGGINIIDLANRYSCSFLATQDLGKMYSDGSFEVLGRFDNSDVRGCNLMLFE